MVTTWATGVSPHCWGSQRISPQLKLHQFPGGSIKTMVSYLLSWINNQSAPCPIPSPLPSIRSIDPRLRDGAVAHQASDAGGRRPVVAVAEEARDPDLAVTETGHIPGFFTANGWRTPEPVAWVGFPWQMDAINPQKQWNPFDVQTNEKDTYQTAGV